MFLAPVLSLLGRFHGSLHIMWNIISQTDPRQHHPWPFRTGTYASPRQVVFGIYGTSYGTPFTSQRRLLPTACERRCEESPYPWINDELQKHSLPLPEVGMTFLKGS